MKILEVKIDELTKEQALEKAREFLISNQSHKIFTPNPEMIVDAQNDSEFKEVLNSGDMNLCDGFGLWLATGRRVERISGVDFMLDLCALAERKGKSIYLLGSSCEEVVKKTAEVLQIKFPLLKIVGYNKGHDITKHGTWNMEQNEDVLYNIITTAPDILFVAFGHGKQEKWIHSNLRDLPSVKIAMGVGGAFDFISGKIKRAPKFIRKIGLEWMWRLLREPKRIKRIFKATFVFLYLLARRKRY